VTFFIRPQLRQLSEASHQMVGYRTPSPAIIRRWYYFASAFFLMQAMEAFGIFDRWVYGEWADKPGDKITQGLNLFLIATSLALFGRGLHRIRPIRNGSAMFLAAAGLLLLSILWSFDPQTTTRRSVLYLFTVVGVIGMASNLDGDEFMDLLLLTCGISAVATILLVAISPGDALMQPSGELRGIFSHKNVLGAVMAGGTLASLHGLRLGRKRRRSAAMLILFAIVATASKSETSLLVIAAQCLVSGVITLLRSSGGLRVIGLCCVIVGVVCLPPIATFVALNPDSLIEAIGKDPTLSGRTELWAYVLSDIAEKPLMGWGYSAFWSPSDPAAVEISDSLMWSVPEAHNGILEMLLNIGLVGCAYFVFLWIRNIRLALRCMNRLRGEIGVSALLCCITILITGVSETVLMEPFQISTSIFFITGLFCERAIRVRQQRRYQGAQNRSRAASRSGRGSPANSTVSKPLVRTQQEVQ
jgi:exopolysaccharide production protein ExoQ